MLLFCTHISFAADRKHFCALCIFVCMQEKLVKNNGLRNSRPVMAWVYAPCILPLPAKQAKPVKPPKPHMFHLLLSLICSALFWVDYLSAPLPAYPSSLETKNFSCRDRAIGAMCWCGNQKVCPICKISLQQLKFSTTDLFHQSM